MVRIKSVAAIPAIPTHQQQGERGALAGIPANMVKLCVGAEHSGDIIADPAPALVRSKELYSACVFSGCLPRDIHGKGVKFFS